MILVSSLSRGRCLETDDRDCFFFFLWCVIACFCLCFQSVFGDCENTKVRIAELEEEVQTLKKMNKDLYDFSSQLLTKPT